MLVSINPQTDKIEKDWDEILEVNLKSHYDRTKVN